MKRCLLIIAMLLVCTVATAYAQEENKYRLGLHGLYSVAGDIEDSSTGFGLQLGIPIQGNYSIEIAMSKFSDGIDEQGIRLEVDFTTIGVSIVGRSTLGDNLKGYLLGGINYNLVGMDGSYDPLVYGPGLSVDIDVKNTVGFHVGGGLNFPIQDNWELFAEYRYTLLDLDAQISVSGWGMTVSETVSESYDFGLFKIGVNYRF